MSNAGNEITNALHDVQKFYQRIDVLLSEWRRRVLERGGLSPAKDTAIFRTGPDSRPPPRVVGVLLEAERAVHAGTKPSRVVLAVVLPESGDPTVCAVECHQGFKLNQPGWKQLFCRIRSTEPTLPESGYQLLCIHRLTSVSSLADIDRLLVEPVIAQFPRASSRPTP